MKLKTFSLSEAQRIEIDRRSGRSGWRRLHPDEAPSFLPESLVARSVEIVEVSAPTSSGATVVLYNCHRVDAPDRAIDHEPFVVVVHESGTSTGGHFVHHGDWEGRSTPLVIPSEFTGEITSSGVAEYFRARPVTDGSSGPLAELQGGDAAAFERVTGLISISGPGRSSSTSGGSS